MTPLAMYNCERQNSLCLRAANRTGLEDCAHLAHFAAALVPAIGFNWLQLASIGFN
jgi:hypothetical protein